MSCSVSYQFAADRTLGKLAKWLRILGFDTVFESDYSSKWFYEHLEPERVLLTRIVKLRKQFAARRMVAIEANGLAEQLGQVIIALPLSLNDIEPFTRCVKCNSPIVDVTKEDAFGRVPDYIWETQKVFSMCGQCERIFWAGSHTERSREFIRQLFAQQN